jgi:hypothetical protein
MLLFEGWSAKNSWRGQKRTKRECEGYIKDPPKVGSRWEKLTENRLNRFPPGGFRFTGGLSRRLDRPQIRLSRAKIRLHTTFSDRIDWQTGRSESDIGEQCRNRLNRF